MRWIMKRLIFASLALVFIVEVAGYSFAGQPSSTHAASNTIHRSNLAAYAPGEWSTFQNNIWRTGYDGYETTLNATTVPGLKVHWTHTAGGGVSTQPIQVNGSLYWGSWDGLEHKTTLAGADVWTVNLGQTTSQQCVPPTVGIASSGQVITVPINGIWTSVLFVGGGNGKFYALNTATGSILWQTQLGIPPDFFLWSSPIVYNGSVYEGVSSFGDCPLVRGEMVRMNASTGAIENIFYTMPAGCKGAGVWDSPAIDANTGMLYFGTSNAGVCHLPNQYFWSMIELNASNLALVSFWQMPPSQQTPNCDFGLAAPTLFTANIGGVNRFLLGVPNQNGKYYTFDRTRISSGPLWIVQLANPGRGSISSSAWDGTRLYTAGTDTTINGVRCQGSARALNPATGAVIWQVCWTLGRPFNAVVAVTGVIFIGQGHFVNALDSTTGRTLFRFTDNTPGSLFWGAPSISNGVLYIGNSDKTLWAFGL